MRTLRLTANEVLMRVTSKSANVSGDERKRRRAKAKRQRAARKKNR